MNEIKCICGNKFFGMEGKEDTCPQCLKKLIKMTDETEFLKGMELQDDNRDVRYVLEDYGDNEYIHLTGYDDTCMCEAWYTIEELIEQGYKLTGKTVIVEDLDQDIFTINCTCCDSE